MTLVAEVDLVTEAHLRSLTEDAGVRTEAHPDSLAGTSGWEPRFTFTLPTKLLMMMFSAVFALRLKAPVFDIAVDGLFCSRRSTLSIEKQCLMCSYFVSVEI
jgi:hypothetical protein